MLFSLLWFFDEEWRGTICLTEVKSLLYFIISSIDSSIRSTSHPADHMSVKLPDSTVAIAVRGGSSSRRTVRWAAEYLIPHASHVILVHVIPSVSSVPSPAGSRVDIDKLEKELVDLYVDDLKLKAEQEVVWPIKKLCKIKNVETLVLSGDNIVEVLLKFLMESGATNLVLGPSSFSWIKRILNVPNVPSTVLKLAPDLCNIFVVKGHALKVKLSNKSGDEGNNMNIHKQKINAQVFNQKEVCLKLNKKIASHVSISREMSKILVPSNCDSSTLLCEDVNASIDPNENYDKSSQSTHDSCDKDSNLSKRRTYLGTFMFHDNLDPDKEIHPIMNSIKVVNAPTEVGKLRKELEDTLVMYRRACEGLIHAHREIAFLSLECSNESKKVKDALEREQKFKEIAEEEKAKHLEALKQFEEARLLLAIEALDRHKAETFASCMASEKYKAVDSLFEYGKICRKYSKIEIIAATDNFSEAKKIGEGGYGKVYKCTIDHIPVAIKVLRPETCNKKNEFIREVEVLSQLRHPNMLLLLGGCPESGSLVYEYMENGSLEDKLFDKENSSLLPWAIRIKILFEVACGLSFLHGSKPNPIVHRDLKPGNILLDKNYVSKIGDVGLAKLVSDVVPDMYTEYRDTVLAGTFYYMDPEYQRTGTIRPKSDLYALGIITLQLLTARHPRGLVVDVEKAIDRGYFADLLDKSVADWPIKEAEKLAKLALKCSRLRCRDRPDLDTEVLPELEKLLDTANARSKSNFGAPSHFICPILQEIMDDPYIAGDGYTYEHGAIKAWLEKHKISPVTRLRLPHSYIVPNYSVKSAIQEWKQFR